MLLSSILSFIFCSKVDPYGFERADDFDYNSYEEFMAAYLSSLRGERVNGVTWLVQMVRFPRTENVRARVFPNCSVSIIADSEIGVFNVT